MMPAVSSTLETRAEEAQFDAFCHGRFRAQLELLSGTYVPNKDRQTIVRSVRFPTARRGTTARQLAIAAELRAKANRILGYLYGDRHPVQMQSRTLSIRMGNQWQHVGEPDLICTSSMTSVIFWFEVREGVRTPEVAQNMVLRDMAVLLGRSAVAPSRVHVCSIDRVSDPTFERSVTTYDRGQLAHLEADMFQRLARIHAPNPARTAGWPQCDNCTALAHCRVAAELVTTTVRDASGGLAPTATAESVENALGTVPTERLERFEALAPLVAKLLELVPGALAKRRVG